MNWPESFSLIERAEERAALETELSRELKPGHALFDLPARAIGRRHDQDDVVFQLLDATGRIAEVHLTWTGGNAHPPWPSTLLFASIDEWAAQAGEF